MTTFCIAFYESSLSTERSIDKESVTEGMPNRDASPDTSHNPRDTVPLKGFLLLFRKSLVVGMKRELIHAEELEGRNKRRKEELARLVNRLEV
jgi:hypothetical protein